MNLGVNTLFYIPGEVGGSETYLLEILRQWKKNGTPEEVVLFTQQENHERLNAEFGGAGWRCVLSSFKARNRVVRILREQSELPIRARRAGVDVLWSPGYTSPVLYGRPQAVSLLDMQYKRFPQDLTRVARLTTHLLVQAAAIDRRRPILTISGFAKQDILRFTRAAADRVHVTPLAADAAFCPAGEAPPPFGPPYLLCVANTYPHKAVDALVRAFALLEERIPHRLVILGKPRLGEPAFQEAVREVRDPARIQRISGCTRRELVSWYQHADAFVFPSQYEGFGLPVLEAMQSGVPVITTRCGSIPEVGGDAVSYEDANNPPAFAQAIDTVLRETPETRARRIREGLRRAQEFNWARTAGETLRVLESVRRA